LVLRGPLSGGEGGSEGRGTEQRGRERKTGRGGGGGRERGEGRLTLMLSWNRAADWLRPALKVPLL